MYLAVLAWLLGIVSLQWFHQLPNIFWVCPAIIGLAVICYYLPRPYRKILQLLIIMLLGQAFVVLRTQHILAWQLPADWENKPVIITGMIASLPQITDNTAEFEFQMNKLAGQAQRARIRLSWYHQPDVALHMGDVWQMQVRLKRPHGLMNPGGFDYEKWLFSRGIRATGYVITGSGTRFLVRHPWHFPIDHLRENLQEKIAANLSGENTAGLITALIMGSQSGISPTQWQVMRATGTNHLMAIAGVHIGFVSGFIYLLISWGWRRLPGLSLRWPASQAAAVGCLLVAIIYSALAGFSLPTQRALIMLSAAMLSLFLRRELSSWNSLALALGVILVIDPFTVLTVSFWLSFVAVFAILLGINHRLNPKGLWWKYGRVQWVITLGLIPISIILFQQASLIAFFANLIAVPAVGILVLPWCLTGALLLPIWQPLARILLLLSAKMIAIIWHFLGWMADFQWAVWQQALPSTWVLVAAFLGILLCLAPKGLPGRWLGACWILPLVLYKPAAPQRGEVWLTLLDVGQGLAAVVSTQHHNLLFDAGPKMGQSADAGQRVIIPFLQALGVSRLDRLMVSHGDSDHIGGAQSVIQQIRVTDILSSVPERFSIPKGQLCQAGQTWIWDDVRFTVLYPTPQFLHLGNDSSCVLKIGEGEGAILLTGDIEKMSENYLVQHEGHLLAAQILVAPHHGSRTSSTLGFIAAVGAKYVLFPIGYLNRFHFPSQIVVTRYLRSGAQLLDTAHSGAITFKLDAQGKVKEITEYRKQQRRVWSN